MRFLSVCSGLGGAELAFAGLGWECAGVAEVDPSACAVLKHHWPDVKNFGDFTKIGVEDVGAIDLLVGGTPCQDFSVAGLRAGVDGDRGNLTLEFLRLADRMRPRWLVWENVPGVLSSTSHVAPDPCPPEINLDGPNGPKDGEEVVVEDEYDADENHAFACFLAGLSEFGYEYAYGTLDAQHFGVPQRRHRVFVVGHLGDWRGPAAVLFDQHCLSGHPPPRREAGKESSGSIASGVAGSLGGGGERGWSNDLDRSGAFIPGRYWDGSDIADTLDASNASKQQAMPEKRRFQAVIGLDEEQNATVDGMGCLKARREGGGFEGSVMTPAMRVRRLLPVECARLQSVPDTHLDILYRGKPLADGPKYKLLGNGFCINVVKWIGERIQQVENLHNK